MNMSSATAIIKVITIVICGLFAGCGGDDENITSGQQPVAAVPANQIVDVPPVNNPNPISNPEPAVNTPNPQPEPVEPIQPTSPGVITGQPATGLEFLQALSSGTWRIEYRNQHLTENTGINITSTTEAIIRNQNNSVSVGICSNKSDAELLEFVALRSLDQLAGLLLVGIDDRSLRICESEHTVRYQLTDTVNAEYRDTCDHGFNQHIRFVKVSDAEVLNRGIVNMSSSRNGSFAGQTPACGLIANWQQNDRVFSRSVDLTEVHKTYAIINSATGGGTLKSTVYRDNFRALDRSGNAPRVVEQRQDLDMSIAFPAANGNVQRENLQLGEFNVSSFTENQVTADFRAITATGDSLQGNVDLGF